MTLLFHITHCYSNTTATMVNRELKRLEQTFTRKFMKLTKKRRSPRYRAYKKQSKRVIRTTGQSASPCSA